MPDFLKKLVPAGFDTPSTPQARALFVKLGLAVLYILTGLAVQWHLNVNDVGGWIFEPEMLRTIFYVIYLTCGAYAVLHSFGKMQYFVVDCVLLYICIIIFGHSKSVIHWVVPYNLDAFFAMTDRDYFWPAIQALYALFRPEFMLAILDMAYFLWFFIMYGFLSWFLVQRPGNRDREQFISCFMLLWLVGGIWAAFGFASFGPIFLQDSAPALFTIYQPQWDMFVSDPEKQPILTDVYKMLLDMWLFKTVDINGPSAMPSLHVGMATMMFLSVRKRHIILSSATLIYLVLVQIGSVVLLWHYMLDGVLGMVLAVACWYASGKLLDLGRRREKLQPV